MKRKTELSLINQLLSMIENKETAMAADVYRNPVSDYTDRTQFDAEKALLFRNTPLVVGLSCELTDPGAYLTEDRAGVPILVVRGDDNKLRAFANVCRHRGTKLLRDCGFAKKLISCPYHAWAYSRQGTLEHVPFEQGFERSDRATHGLTELSLEERHGLIWVTPTAGTSVNFDQFLAGLDEDLSSFNLQNYHHYETRTLSQRMNWKLVVDTFLETYHLGALHRATVYPIIHGNVGTFDPFGSHLRNIYARRSMDQLREVPEESWDLIEQTAMIYVLFPNTVLVMQGDHIETWRIFPDYDDVNKTEMAVSLYTPELAKSESAKGHWDRNMDLLVKTVVEEDFPIGEEIQRGFYSGAQSEIIFGRNEPGLAHFHQRVKQVVC